MRIGKRVRRAVIRGLGAAALGMIVGVVLEEENKVSQDQAFLLGVGAGIGAAGFSLWRSGR